MYGNIDIWNKCYIGCKRLTPNVIQNLKPMNENNDTEVGSITVKTFDI
jgi:hypothetical protein